MSTKQQGNKVLSVEVKPIHTILATIIKEQLIDNGIAATAKNCERHITRHLRSQYCIRKETVVTLADYKIALPLAREQRKQTSFREPSSHPDRSLELVERLHQQGKLTDAQYEKQTKKLRSSYPTASTGTS